MGKALVRIAAATDMITRKVRQEAHTPRRRTFVAVGDVRVMSVERASAAILGLCRGNRQLSGLLRTPQYFRACGSASRCRVQRLTPVSHKEPPGVADPVALSKVSCRERA
jgi:hypothetical protein